MRLIQAGRLSRLGVAATGLDKQDEAADRYATAYGHLIIATVADADVSGGVPPWERPELGPWLRADHLDSYDGLIFATLDRLGRNARHISKMRDWAEDHNKVLIVVSPALQWPPAPEDLASPIIWDVLARLAEYELAAITKRNKETQAWLRANDFFSGKPPYGYMIVPVDGTKHKTLKPDPVTGPIVQEMVRRYLEGQSTRQIRDWLNEAGIPAPQPPKNRKGYGWGQSTVSRTLKNSAIAGRLQVKGQTVLRMEPLVSIEDFDKVQAEMKRRSHHGAPTGTTAMLTGILFCDNGQPMYRVHTYGGDVYYCRERCPKGQRRMVPVSHADDMVNEAVMSRGWMPHETIVIDTSDDYSEQIGHIRADIRELDPEALDYDDRLANFRTELAKLRQQQASAKPTKVSRQVDGRTVGQVWETLDTPGRRAWLTERGWRAVATGSGSDAVILVEPGEYAADLLSLRTVGGASR